MVLSGEEASHFQVLWLPGASCRTAGAQSSSDDRVQAGSGPRACWLLEDIPTLMIPVPVKDTSIPEKCHKLRVGSMHPEGFQSWEIRDNSHKAPGSL